MSEDPPGICYGCDKMCHVTPGEIDDWYGGYYDEPEIHIEADHFCPVANGFTDVHLITERDFTITPLAPHNIRIIPGETYRQCLGCNERCILPEKVLLEIGDAENGTDENEPWHLSGPCPASIGDFPEFIPYTPPKRCP